MLALDISTVASALATVFPFEIDKLDFDFATLRKLPLPLAPR